MQGRLWAGILLTIGLACGWDSADRLLAIEGSLETPRGTVAAYFRMMDREGEEAAEKFLTNDSVDELHMIVEALNIHDRLKLHYELSTEDRALVVAAPMRMVEKKDDDAEVIYAELEKGADRWRIRRLGRISPEDSTVLMQGFQINSKVRLNVAREALIGEWNYPCQSRVVLKEDGLGTNEFVGPGAPDPNQKPEEFLWDVDGSCLRLKFADRKVKFEILSIDHRDVHFDNPEGVRDWGWHSRWSR